LEEGLEKKRDPQIVKVGRTTCLPLRQRQRALSPVRTDPRAIRKGKTVGRRDERDAANWDHLVQWATIHLHLLKAYDRRKRMDQDSGEFT